jgi:hypothetical protein
VPSPRPPHGGEGCDDRFGFGRRWRAFTSLRDVSLRRSGLTVALALTEAA